MCPAMCSKKSAFSALICIITLQIRTATSAMCVRINGIQNAVLEYSADPVHLSVYPEGTRVYMRCNPAYIAVGNTVSYCRSSDKFDPPLGSCVPVDSGRPCKPIENFAGAITYLPPISARVPPPDHCLSGTVAVFTCPPNTIIDDNPQALCFDSKWSQTTARCRGILEQPYSYHQENPNNGKQVTTGCRALEPVEDGTLYYSKNEEDGLYPVYSFVNLFCEKGFVRKGRKRATCDTDGNWTPNLGKCVAYF